MPRFAALLTMSVALFASSVPHARAQTPTPAPAAPAPASIGLGAVVFYDYTFTAAPASTDAAGQSVHANGFNVSRTYVNVTGRVAPHVTFRITPDVTRTANSGGTTDGSLTFRLKYGYAQFELDRFTGRWTNTWIRGGIQQTPFIDSVEGIYRYRFQGTLFAERDGGLSSADAGVSAHADLPGGYGDVHVGLYNGEGYSKAEVNDQKALQVRATVRPVPGSPALGRLRLTAYLHRDHVMRNAERHRFIGAAFFEHARFNAGIEYLGRDDRATPGSPLVESDGVSMFVTPFFGAKGSGFEALLRYDTFRPDVSASSTRRQRTIAGLAYWMPHPGGRGTAALLLDLEQVRHRNDPAGRPTERRVTLHGLINF